MVEEAVAEAEAVEDAQTLRWASHDLGVALGMVGDHDAAVLRVEDGEILDQGRQGSIEVGEAGVLEALEIVSMGVPSPRADTDKAHSRLDEPADGKGSTASGLSGARTTTKMARLETNPAVIAALG